MSNIKNQKIISVNQQMSTSEQENPQAMKSRKLSW